MLIYMDDLIISSIDIFYCETGKENLRVVLEVASEVALAINWLKHQFLQ